MPFDIEDAVSSYANSEYFLFLDTNLKNHAEPLLLHILRELDEQSPDFPSIVPPQAFSDAMNSTTHLDLPSDIRRKIPHLLKEFFDYLSTSGKHPQAQTWSTAVADHEENFLARIREDGSVKGETFKRAFKPVGRNEPCPCGSGKKFKKCCMNLLS
ncbi:MAG: SEC-C metal-binding domain-containing protein [bacterium]|nr:SEC-C metal-binding domain-containing protein [bacterium]